MLRIDLPDPCIDLKQEAAWLGKFFDEKSFDRLIDFDCDVYRANGEPLLMLRRNVLDKSMCANAYNGLRKAATVSLNRGSAAGPFVDHKNEYVASQNGTSTRAQKILQDGTLSKVTRANPVNSGVSGFLDRSNRLPFCRQTVFNQTHSDLFSMAIPLINRVDQLFSELLPQRYQAQRSAADSCSQDFIIRGTSYSTVTVNSNYRSAGHRDAGDFKAGFSNLAVLEGGKYLGGYFVIPKYRIAVDARTTDLLLVDAHEIHGNTEIKGRHGHYNRLSLVLYLREKMVECGSIQEELERAKRLRV